MLNWGLIKSPLNWLTIILMVIIGAFAFQEVLRFAGAGTDSGDCGCHNSLFPVPQSANPKSES